MLSLLFTFLVLTFAAKRSRKKYDLDYHELKELREEMILKNQRERDLFSFYAQASKQYTSWSQPKPEHFQRRPKKGDEVWFFNEEELWWQTGIAGNMTRGSVENGVWLAQVSPTQWPKGGGYTKKQMRVMYPDKKRISWQSQKLCDMGTQQKEFKDSVMAKRLFNVAKSVSKTNQYAYIGLARWFINSNKWDEAYEMCQKAVELEKRWFLPYMYMGIIKRRQGQDAAAAAKKSKRGAPEGPSAAEYWRVSLRHFKEAMELNPGNVGALNNLAHFYYYVDKNHRKSCFWHRVLHAFRTDKSRAVKNLGDHIKECDEVQPRFDKEEL